MNSFISNLATALNDFVTLKNSLGIEYKTGAVYLRQLDKYNFELTMLRLLPKRLL